MSAATNADAAPNGSEAIAREVAELRDRRELKAASVADRTREIESFRERIGETVAEDGDARPLRQELRDAEDDRDGLERAVAKLNRDIAAAETRLAEAKRREADHAAAVAREAYRDAIREAHDVLRSFLADVFVPLDARLTALGSAANKAGYAQTGGMATPGMAAAERVMVEHRHEREQAGDTRHWLPKLLMDLREIARAARVDTTPDHS